MSIVASQVVKSYGEVQALRGVSLEIPTGSIFGLIGPNGAGKTTFFSLVLGYIEPTSGSVSVLAVSPHDLHRLPGKVGALPQDADLPPAVTIDAALQFFARIASIEPSQISAEVDRVLTLVDLAKWRRAKIRQLSHGMKKRVGLAQALLGKPELIVLDEPTAGLDPKHAHELLEVISKLRGTTTVLISSHNLNELETLCDRAAILSKGQIVRVGTMNEIRRSDALVVVALGSGPELNGATLSQTLGNADVEVDQTSRRVSLRCKDDGIDTLTTQALRVLIEQGHHVREVSRGQSLLSTYLEISKT
jgi:ABC-2 type transport system ATP-binding protein